jgi:hypothetical protein
MAEMDSPRSIHRKDEEKCRQKRIIFIFSNLNGRHYFEDLEQDGKIKYK